jgi:hypothetical protein
MPKNSETLHLVDCEALYYSYSSFCAENLKSLTLDNVTKSFAYTLMQQVTFAHMHELILSNDHCKEIFPSTSKGLARKVKHNSEDLQMFFISLPELHIIEVSNKLLQGYTLCELANYSSSDCDNG